MLNINIIELAIYIIIHTFILAAIIIFTTHKVIKNCFKSPDNKHLINNIINPIIFAIDNLLNKDNEK